MTSSNYIVAIFEAAFEAFEKTNECPTDLYVTQIYDAISKIFYPIRCDSVGGRHNLMELIDDDDAYATEYGESFPWPSRPGICASDIDATKDASLDSRKKEVIHTARIADWEIYDMAESKANCFIFRVVADVWISPISKGSPTFYMKRTTKELLDQLQVVCSGHHTIDFLAL